MIYDVIITSRFKKDYKRMRHRGVDMAELDSVIDMLRRGIALPERYHDHLLSGNFNGHRECHIKPDWLLIYYINENILVLTLTRTGSHSDLFN